jgi:hypothetical protein
VPPGPYQARFAKFLINQVFRDEESWLKETTISELITNSFILNENETTDL